MRRDKTWMRFTHGARRMAACTILYGVTQPWRSNPESPHVDLMREWLDTMFQGECSERATRRLGRFFKTVTYRNVKRPFTIQRFH